MTTLTGCLFGALAFVLALVIALKQLTEYDRQRLQELRGASA
jgi:flagellar biogenesis protein FliO